MGHRIANCLEPLNKWAELRIDSTLKNSNKNKPNSCVFAITQEDPNDANDVVSCNILLNKLLAYVLFDCPANHSFIFKRFTTKLGIQPEILVESFRAATLTTK